MFDESYHGFEHRLVQAAAALGLQVLETTVERDELGHVRVMFKLDPDILSSAAWALIYTIGALSFSDARSCNESDADFAKNDRWTVADMMNYLLFENGRLYFYVDSVRGRVMNTTIEIDQDGEVLLETAHRGEAPVRWIARLRGELLLTLVSE